MDAVSSPLALGIDIGGTSVRVALVRDGRILERADAATDAGLDETVVHLARGLAEGKGVARIGVGVPEYVHAGRVTSAEVIPWHDSIADSLRAIAPVTIESDVRCGALAEWSAGSGSVFYVSWGTGISSTLVLADGTVWEGAHGRAIAFGERLVAGSSLESIVSGRGIEDAYHSRSGVRLSARELTQRDDAHTLFRSAGVLVADALYDAVRLLDPHRVVLGGGVGSADTPAGRALAERWAELGLPVPVTTAVSGADAGLLGSALVALR